MKRTATLGAVVLVLSFGAAEGADTAPADSVKMGFKSSGYVYWENFRLGAADYSAASDKVSTGGTDINRGDWFNSILGGMVLENAMSEHLATRVALEASFSRPFPENNFETSRYTKYNAYIHEAKALYDFRDTYRTQVEVGYFLYDYNPDQQNLGEYLFRSKIYPLNLFTNFELPKDRLLGIRLGTELLPGLHQDLLLTSEYKYYPKSDYTLSYVVDYHMGAAFDLGAGASCVHCLAVKPSYETPHNDKNMYVTIPNQTFTDSAGKAHTVAARDGLPDLVKNDTNYSYESDQGTQARSFYPQMQVDTGYYTFRGVSLMGRFSFDPKPVIGSSSVFGAQDLKFYGETAVLGVKDYPFYYSKLSQRIPWMLGFNLPAFHFLDVLSLELEYCSYPFPDDWQTSLREGLPIPGGQSFSPSSYADPATHSNYVYSPWKWSIYLRKEVARGLYVSAQVARDHLRLADYNGYTYEEILKTGPTPSNTLLDALKLKGIGQYWAILRVTASY